MSGRRGRPGDPAERARRLLRWYPPSWRRRYGDEFAALLEDDIRERPHSARRTADILRAGLLARAAAGGIGGEATGERRLRLDLVLFAAVAIVFVVAGLSMWSQLEFSWQWVQWSQSNDAGLHTAMWLMSGAVIALAPLALLLGGALVAGIVRAVRAGELRGLLAPLAAAVTGAAVLCAGSYRFGGVHWAGTAGHRFSGGGLVPAEVPRLVWAGSWWLSAYWAHPSALLHFSPGTVAWMVISPLALAVAVAGLALTVRRLAPPPGLLRLLATAAVPAVAVMAALLAGAGSWVLDGRPGGSDLFGTGTVDVAELTAMALAFIAASRLSVRAAAVAWRR